MTRIASVIVVVFLLVQGCGKSTVNKEDDPRYKDKRVVVRIGDQILTLGELHQKFRDQEFDNVEQEYEAKKDYAENMIDRYVIVESAKAAGLTCEIDSATIQGFLYQELYKRDAGIKSEITDNDVRDHFERYGGEVQFGPLIVKDSALIYNIYRQLENGADWDSLVLAHTIVGIGEKRGGSLGYVPFGQYDEEIQGKAYDLEIGEYTKPFRIRQGWCIVKLFDRIKNTDRYLEENWDMYNRITTNYTEILLTDKYKEKLRDDYDYKINWQNIEMLSQVSDSIKNTGELPADMPGSAYLERAAFTAEQLDLLLAEFKDGGVTVDDYLNLLESYNPYKSPDLRDRFEMEYILKDIATRRIMTDRALKLGYDTLQSFKNALKRYEENWLIQEFNKQLFAQMDPVTDEDIQEYYGEHPDEYFRPDQVRVSAISLKTKEEALEILEKLKMGASFSALAQKYSTDKKTAVLGGDLNFFTEKRYTEIYDAARGMDVGEIGGPVEMYGNYWDFMVTLRLNRERRPLNVAWSNIRSKILTDRRKQTVRSYADKKKENTDYFLDLDLLKDDLGINSDSGMRASSEEEDK
jgi:peptidyl-prolyl cis-trans isomerase C